MIKKYIPFHQFKKFDESIISEILDSNDISADLNLSYQDMIDSAEKVIIVTMNVRLVFIYLFINC